MRFLIIAAALALSGSAAIAGNSYDADREARDAAKLDKALAGLTPGKPVSCISMGTRSYTTQTIGRTILYKDSRRLVYRNDTSGGCEGTAGRDSLVSQNYGTQLCRGQYVRAVDLRIGYESGSCALGDFVPYRR